MRIIAGKYKGRNLKAPKGEETRPTADRVREAEMSSIISARGGMEGAVVLDAFAGSGALGLEAMSRGADRVWLFESAPAAQRVLIENVKLLGIEPPQARVRKADVFERPPLRARPPFDLVFLDPPYAFEPADVLGLVRQLAASGALDAQVIVMYEHNSASNGAVEEAAPGCGLRLAQRRKYGDTVVDMLRLEA